MTDLYKINRDNKVSIIRNDDDVVEGAVRTLTGYVTGGTATEVLWPVCRQYIRQYFLPQFPELPQTEEAAAFLEAALLGYVLAAHSDDMMTCHR